MRKYIIFATGFIGDNVFASSVPKKLNEIDEECHITFVTSVPNILCLFRENPYINQLHEAHSFKFNPAEYDKVIALRPIHRKLPPAVQFQIQAGILNVTPDYKIYYTPKTQYALKHKIIAIQSNWEERSFLYTKEQYSKGIDVPNLGYGGAHRNIAMIVSGLYGSLESSYMFVKVGKPAGYNVMRTTEKDELELEKTVEVLSQAEYFIGSEGGLCNIAAGVGCKTIITGDFVHQLYGPNGVLEQNAEPMLGPKYYFNPENHITLDPYLTDEEVIEQIVEILK